MTITKLICLWDNYIISPRLQDSYSSDDGNTYTLDALFSLSPDGEQWSDTYDDVLDGSILPLKTADQSIFWYLRISRVKPELTAWIWRF